MIQHHTVVPGDTLSAIARRYGVTVKAIATANSWIADINLVKPGWVFHIPEPAKPDPEPEPDPVEPTSRVTYFGDAMGPAGSPQRLIRPYTTWIGAFRNSTLNVPHKWQGSNAGTRAAGLYEFAYDGCVEAHDRFYSTEGSGAGNFMWSWDDPANGGFGPLAFNSIRMSQHVVGLYTPNPKDYWKPANLATPERIIGSVFEKAKSATGSLDVEWSNYWRGIYTASEQAVRGIDNWFRRTVTCMGHENNGKWYGDCYSGVILFLIGHPALANRDALIADWGEDLGQLLYNMGQPYDPNLEGSGGDCGPLFVRCFRRFADIGATYSEDRIMEFNRAHPGAVPFGEDNSEDGITRSWNPAAFPGADYVDIFSIDLYGSSGALPTVKDVSNFDPRNPDHWDLSPTLEKLVELRDEWAIRYNRPMSIRELGCRLPKNGGPAVGGGGADAPTAMMMRTVWDFVANNDFVYVNQWLQGDNKEAGQSYTSKFDPVKHPLTTEAFTDKFGRQ